MSLLRKKIWISLDQVFETDEDDFRPIKTIGVHPTSTLVIEVDGVAILEVPEIRKFTLRDPSKFRELEERLVLLEKVLAQADVFGTAVVIREPGGTYLVPSMANLRITVEAQG